MSRVILVDVDGVVADLVGALCARYNAAHPRHPLFPENFKTPEFSEGFAPDIVASLHAIMVEPGFVQTLAHYPGAIEAINLTRKTTSVVFVTKPYLYSATWMYDRQKWLETRFGRSVCVIHTARKSLIRGDVLIEDTPKNLVSWLDANPRGEGILIRRPWNTDEWGQYADRVRISDCL